jgi:hypothetical protein
MIKSTIKIIKLEASDGMMLTNGDVISACVYLGLNDSPDNWHEITIEEAAAKEKEAQLEL